MGLSSGVPSDRTSTPREFRERYAARMVANVTHLSHPSEGICHGMCLDWVRLMLNGRIELFKAYATVDVGVAGLILQQQEKMHKLFHGATSDVTDELSRDVQTVLGRVRTATTLREQQHHQRALREIGAQAKDDAQMYSLYYERFRERFRQEFVSFLTFDRIDLDLGRTVTGGDPARNLGDWFAAVQTYLQMLPHGCCAMLQMFKRGGSGHFIAFYRHNDKLHLFDPNFGWLVGGDLDRMMEMFKDLWYAAYRGFGYDASNWRAFRRV